MAAQSQIFKALPLIMQYAPSQKRELVLHNVLVCQQSVSINDIKNLIVSRRRLLFDQTMAIVIAALPDIAVQLASTVADIFDQCNMWYYSRRVLAPKQRSGFAERELRIEELMTLMQQFTNDATLQLYDLRRIRRSRMKMQNQQGLVVPFNFDELMSGEALSQLELRDTIVISRVHFSRLQRRLDKMTRPRSPQQLFANEVAQLVDSIATPPHMTRELLTDDIYALCYILLKVQRDLWSLAAAEYSSPQFVAIVKLTLLPRALQLQQIKVEQLIADKAIDGAALNNLQLHHGTIDEITKQVTEVCLLMHKYVDLYGDGKLGYQLKYRRKAMHYYNSLCEMLTILQLRAKSIGESLPINYCYKFLLSKAMRQPQFSKFDAFENDREPGWVKWLCDHGQ